MNEIGAKSLELMKEVLEGKNVPQEVFIESRVVYRKSCGCKGSKDDFATDEDQFRAMQANYVQSETLLRMVSHIGQDLNYGETFGALKYVVRQNLNELGMNNFAILRFSNGNLDNSHFKGMPVDPLFVRRSGNECSRRTCVRDSNEVRQGADLQDQLDRTEASG